MVKKVKKAKKAKKQFHRRNHGCVSNFSSGASTSSCPSVSPSSSISSSFSTSSSLSTSSSFSTTSSFSASSSCNASPSSSAFPTSISSTPPHGESPHDRLSRILAQRYTTRAWNPTGSKAEASFTIVSYNILANSAVQENTAKYRGFTPDRCNWESRRALLLDEIERMDPDILCMQELDQVDHAGVFGARMTELGFSSVFRKRHNTMAFGNAVFYRQTKVSLLHDIEVCCEEGEVVRGVERAGIFAIFAIDDGLSRKRVCIATTHLVNDRPFTMLGQLCALFSEAQKWANIGNKMPFIITGDFNARSGGILCNYVQKGEIDLSKSLETQFIMPVRRRASHVIGPAHLETSAKFKWETRVVRNDHGKIKNAKRIMWKMVKAFDDLRHLVVRHAFKMASVYDSGRAIDHIFHGQVSQRPGLELISVLELPTEVEDLRGALPAAHYGSDHLAIGAKFRFI
ncbi:hypothetical protein BGX28_008760 [Mortierella sp. GBA30]|nr:hypothetical protein BGX28_008760 [Mortierella sp. GBA30]